MCSYFVWVLINTLIVLIQMVQLVDGLKLLWCHSHLPCFAFEGSVHIHAHVFVSENTFCDLIII